MKTINILLMSVLLVLAACQSAPLFPDNESASFDVNQTLPDDTLDDVEDVSDEIENTTEETVDEIVSDLEEVTNDDYQAIITATEGDLVELQTRATDPDGDDVTITYGAPFDENGAWQTVIGDAGEYEVDLVASDGQAETEARILVVIESANAAPVISGPETITVEETETVDLGVFTIVDPDGDEFITSYSGWMRASEYTTTYDDAGQHTVRIIAEDTEGNQAMETVTIVVENVNRPPTITLERDSLTVVEGEDVDLGSIMSVDDPDGGDVTVEFEDPLSSEGVWSTQEGDAGTYRIDIVASDGED